MRVDAYTKAVLTVIAACLVWLCLQRTFTVASADAPQEVVLTGVRGAVPVVTAPRTSLVVRPGAEWYDNELPIGAPRPLPTRLMAVERGSGKWDPLDVMVKEQGRKTTPGH